MGTDRIILVGFMGSGKSTLGRALAEKLHFRFEDLDELVERESGMKVSEIFRSYGEKWFRKVERKFLLEMLEVNRMVLSTGGGAACHLNQVEEMLGAGLVVYLRCSAETLYRRLQDQSDDRPLLQGLKGEVLREFIGRMLAMREPWYLKAQLVIDADQADADLIYDSVASFISS